MLTCIDHHPSSAASQWHALTALLVVTLLVAGCAAGPTAPGPREASPAAAAQRWYEQGDFRAAERAFLALAEADPADRDGWLLRAADAAFQDGVTGRSELYLRRLDQNRLDPEQRRLAGLLSLLTGIVDDPSPHTRLRLLDAPDESWPDSYRPALHRLRAEAYLESANPYRAALELIGLGDWLPDPSAAQRNRTEILTALGALSARQATELLRAHRREEQIYGWLALIAAIKHELFAGGEPERAIAAWRSRFPTHPAAMDPLESMFLGRRPAAQRARTIALLLPTTGRLAEPAAAVRSGFVSAYLSDPERQAQVRFYDTGTSPGEALVQYRRAVDDGAEQIVGPLDRDAVTAVLLEADGRVPVLALNYQQGDAPTAPGNLQLGLLPEDEAEAAAQRMLADGILRASVLVPEGEWGQRISDAFSSHYQRLGGVVFDIQRFSEEQLEFGPLIRHLVGVSDSELRHRALSRTLGRTLAFEAQPRRDLDGIFLAGRSVHARSIKPQLAFFNAGRVPVYSTSRIYDGIEDPNANRDLNGIVFCDVPFLLNGEEFQPTLAAAQQAFTEARGPGARLFAIGADAYRLLPYLNWLQSLGSEAFPGATGRLSVDSHGRFHRKLDCGRFERGLAVYRPDMGLAAE